MALDYQVESLESLDEAVKGLYLEKEGKYYLDVAGVKPMQDFDNVQKALNNERKISKDFEKKLKAFGERTPESFSELEQQISELKVLADSNQNNTDDVKERIENIKTDYEGKLNAAKEASMKKELEKDSIIEELKNTIVEGRKKDAILEEAKTIAKSESLGDVMSLLTSMIVYNEDMDQFEERDTGLDVKATVEKFFKDRPYFVKESTSGGAKGNLSGSVKENPFKNGNMTAIGKLIKENRPLAERKAKEAGVKLP